MLDIAKPLFAFVRAHRITKLADLEQQERHAARTSPTAATRPGAVRGRSIYWSAFGSASCKYVDDFKAHKASTGARERGGAALGLHLLVGVSPEWLAEAGDIHDVYNDRVKRLFEVALAFGQDAIGGVYAARMDLDERGGGVVDLFLAPVYERQAKLRKDGTRGAPVQEISVKKALSGLQRQAGGGRSFAALQTIWSAHACAHLDARIVRGVPVAITGRKHLTVPEFRYAAEEAKAHDLRREGERMLALNTLAFIGDEQDRLRRDKDDLDKRSKAQDDREQLLASRELVIDTALVRYRHDMALLELERNELAARDQDLGRRSVALEDRSAHMDACERDVAEAQEILARARDAAREEAEAVQIRQTAVIEAEAELAKNRAHLARREEHFALQRFINESDLAVSWSRVAAAEAFLESRQDEAIRRIADDRSVFDAEVEAARRVMETRAVEVASIEAAAHAREAALKTGLDLIVRETHPLRHYADVAELELAQDLLAKVDQAITARTAAERDRLKEQTERALAREQDARRAALDAANAGRGMHAAAQMSVRKLRELDENLAAAERRAAQLAAAERSLSERQNEIEADRQALVAGVERIATGSIEDEGGLHSLPASPLIRNLLRKVLTGMAAAMSNERRRLAREEGNAVFERRRAEAARLAAEKREAQALNAQDDVEHRRANLDRRGAELVRKERDVAQMAVQQRAAAEAMALGLSEVTSGALSTEADLEARTDLTAAKAALGLVLSAIGRRVHDAAERAHDAIQAAIKAEESHRLAAETAGQAEIAARAREDEATKRISHAARIVGAIRELERSLKNRLASLPAEVRTAYDAYRGIPSPREVNGWERK